MLSVLLGLGSGFVSNITIFPPLHFKSSTITRVPRQPSPPHASGGSASAQPCYNISTLAIRPLIAGLKDFGSRAATIRPLSARLGEEMNRDRYDQSLSTGSERAAAFYRDGVDRM